MTEQIAQRVQHQEIGNKTVAIRQAAVIAGQNQERALPRLGQFIQSVSPGEKYSVFNQETQYDGKPNQESFVEFRTDGKLMWTLFLGPGSFSGCNYR